MTLNVISGPTTEAEAIAHVAREGDATKPRTLFDLLSPYSDPRIEPHIQNLVFTRALVVLATEVKWSPSRVSRVVGRMGKVYHLMKAFSESARICITFTSLVLKLSQQSEDLRLQIATDGAIDALISLANVRQADPKVGCHCLVRWRN